MSALEATPPGAIVFGALADKAWREMLDILKELPSPRFYVAPQGRAAAAPSDLAAHTPGLVSTSLPLALTKAHRVAGKSAVLVCGSLYLVGEARALLLGEPMDPPVAL